MGGLIATTSDMRDADFLAGKYEFAIASRNPNATVVNQGSIKAATGGSAVLSGARVVNDGVIEAKFGKVVLAGANAFSVDFDGDNLIRFAIAAPVSETPKDVTGEPAPALVSNSGTIAAQGGKILLTARAARSVVNNVINSTGIIEANSASMQNGRGWNGEHRGHAGDFREKRWRDRRHDCAARRHCDDRGRNTSGCVGRRWRRKGPDRCQSPRHRT